MDEQLVVLQWMQQGISRRLLGRAIKHFGSISNLLAHPVDALQPFFPQASERLQVHQLHQDVSALQQKLKALAITVIFPGHKAWPERLGHLYDPPAWLLCRGNVDLLQSDQLAIVGSRRATPAGLRFTESLAKSVAETDWVVTSGLALGIDAAAHQGEVSNTIAVLGNGIDKPYPARNKGLYQQIVENGGLVVSEALLGESPQPWHFPARNRIIAALSKKLLVVEAAVKSGSLITAEIALDLGREVYAVPGGVYAPASAGCLALLKQGAEMVTTVEDLDIPAKMRVDAVTSLNEIEARVVNAIAAMPMTENKLAICLNIPLNELSNILLSLELSGRIVHAPGGYHIR
ncbi:DNA-processing protein DprA [Salinibius halmophilus]|uniref:DNA-processing protein DprA n=1 Tax=Salinibius halmophilus TaxID=1853216 RepID=UPI000E66F9AD|nr:DNA-processing protein DprA [Salinibius halmophilus]